MVAWDMIEDAMHADLMRWLDHAEAAEWILEAWLFGSRAKGNHQPDSDYDLAFTLKDEPGRTAEAEAICMRKIWNADLGRLLGVSIDAWWLNDPHSNIVGPAVKDHGICLWRRGPSA